MNKYLQPAAYGKPFLFCTLLALLGHYGCQLPLDIDPVEPDTYEPIDFNIERLILDLYATPSELYAVTGSHFYRFDSTYNNVANVSLEAADGEIGIPVLSDNVYAYVKSDPNGQEVLEFRLPRNPTVARRFTLSGLAEAADNAFLSYRTARRVGAFDANGEQFVLPVRVLAQPVNYTAFLFFEIRQNPTLSDILYLEYTNRVDIQDLAADDNTLTSIRFFDEAYFVATEEGAFRITPDGVATRLFFQRMTDFFALNGTLYATGFNDADLHRSFDGGISWERLSSNTQSKLKHVERQGDFLFTQRVRGFPYQIADPDDNDLERVLDIDYPEDFPLTSFDKFYGVAFFNGRYHFSVDNEIYHTGRIVTE